MNIKYMLFVVIALCAQVYGADELPQCGICLDPLIIDLYKLPKTGSDCGHIFHHECLDEWVKREWACPLCKTSIDETYYKKPIISIKDLLAQGWQVRQDEDNHIYIMREYVCFPLKRITSFDGVTNVTNISLFDFFLDTLPNMSMLSTLKELDLSWNEGIKTPLGSLPEGLQKLLLRCCGLKRVPEDIAGMATLEILDLSGNEGINITEGSLPEGLQELALGTCGLEEVPRDVKTLASLKILNLSDNKGIKVLDESLLVDLQELKLNFCDLQEVPRDVAGMAALEILDLSGNNKGIEIPLGSLPGDLRKLVLSWNEGIKIPEGSLPGCLQELELGACGLEEAPKDVIKMAVLKILDLSYNKGIKVSKGSLPGCLQKLILDHCNLEEVPKDVIKMDALEILDLSDNEGVKIPLGSLPAGLQELYLIKCGNKSYTHAELGLPETVEIAIESYF